MLIDAAVGLVQAHLQVNGFFARTECPVVAEWRRGHLTLMDVDVLAVRFPGAECRIPEVGRGGHALPPDPRLAAEGDRLQMIIGEVEEGRARPNQRAYSSPAVEEAI